MKKISLFSLLTATLLCVGATAMAQTTIFHWQMSGTAAPANDVAIAATGGTITPKCTASDAFGVETAKYADTTPSDMQALNGKGLKSGKNSLYLVVTPAEGMTFLKGDVLQICGYLPWKVSSSAAHSGDLAASVETGADKNSYTVGEVVLPADANELYLMRAQGKSTAISAIKVIRKAAAVDDATLKSITVDGVALETFDPATLAYSIELPYGTTAAPVVAATANSDKATVAITQAENVNGTATIAVTAEDGTTTKTYTLTFSVAATVSHDATLQSLTIDGKSIAGFKADSLDYTYVVAYTATDVPQIAAEVNDASATMVITQAAAAPGTATVVVTAQDGTTVLTYTVAIERANAIKHLTVVPFSNGAMGAINETDLTITATYLAGTDVPAVVAEGIQVSGDGTPTAVYNENTITLTGIDNVSAEYTIVLKALAAADLGADLITFNGEEAYIYGAYGWDASKGWKFSKAVDEEGNMRIAAGKTRIYLAFPPAASVLLTSGSNGGRAINVYINGVKSDVTATAASNSAITLPLNPTANNFVCIESNQTKGDGGFTAMQLVNPKSPVVTAIENAKAASQAVKVVRNGQLLIIRDGKAYTAQGVAVE